MTEQLPSGCGCPPAAIARRLPVICNTPGAQQQRCLGSRCCTRISATPTFLSNSTGSWSRFGCFQVVLSTGNGDSALLVACGCACMVIAAHLLAVRCSNTCCGVLNTAKGGCANARQSGRCGVQGRLTTSTVSRAYMLSHHAVNKHNDAVCGHGERCSSGCYVSSSSTKPRCGAIAYHFRLVVKCTHQQLCWNAAAAHVAPCLCGRVPLKFKYGRLMH